jgi:predicted O-methyltransferase YrrM
MIPFGEDEGVKIDIAHANLLTGLVKANKPKNILEIGIGGGQSTDAILEALEFNQVDYHYTVVDNWYDWGRVRPDGVNEKYADRVDIVDSDEKDFVFSTTQTFDFIMSDGDHFNTQKWFEHVYDKLLNPNGILVYHDINTFNEPDSFPNLLEIYAKCKEYGLPHHLFNSNSRDDERCQRGLLVIFKHE